jgi:ribonuclease R
MKQPARSVRRTAPTAGHPDSPPTREDILAFIAREREAGRADKIGKREIARAFNIKGTDKITLKRILRELEDDQKIARRKKGFVTPGALPPVTLADITRIDADGDLVAVPVEWDEAQFGEPPRILIHPRKPKPGEPAPGVGDRALLRTERLREKIEADPNGPAWSGRVIKLLSRAKARVLGIYRTGPRGGRIEPIDRKQIGREYSVSDLDRGEAEDGDLVAVEVLRGNRFGLSQARVREVVGAMASEKAVSLIALHAHSIPDAFRADTLAEAEAARETSLSAEGFSREDWRDVPLVTIDPPDAKDHDDAVFAEPDPANPGGFIVCVAIADVSFHVRPHSALDREALVRGNSVYFPDRVVPMLPEKISNDLCSLVPGRDRPALAVKLVIAPDGRKVRHSFHRIMMRSAAKLAYAQAQAAFDGKPDEVTAPLAERVLKPLFAAYECVRKARDMRGPLDLDLPERKILLKADGTVDRVITPPRLEAHRLIEEFMILANVAAAETLEDKRQKLVYRAHDEPSAEKLSALSEFLSTIGVRLAKGQTIRAAAFNTILARVKDTEHENLVNEVVLRAQAQAEYTAENYGHFGLNLRRYAHFTSPIRRYADLIVHRALVRALGLGPGALPDMPQAELAEIAARISAAERRAMAAERETNDRLIAGWLADRIGAIFAGRVAGVTRAGLFVKLRETGADGFVPISTLGDERFHFEEATNALVGSRSGLGFRLGDLVDVRLVEAAPMAGALRFEMMSEPRRTKLPAAKAKGGAFRRPNKAPRNGRSR